LLLTNTRQQTRQTRFKSKLTYLPHVLFRSTLSRPNKVGLKCPSIRPPKSFFDFNEIWHASLIDLYLRGG